MVPSDEQQFAAVGGQLGRCVEIMAAVQKVHPAAVEVNAGQGVFRLCNGDPFRFLVGFRIPTPFVPRMDFRHGD